MARHAVQGSGPTLLAFDRAPAGYFEALASTYRVVVMDYPPEGRSQAFIDSFTADRVCADILAVADSVDADRFGWYGFSWGAGVGLQLAARTNRLTTLACGGWPPLGGQYRETLAVTEAGAAQGGDRRYLPYYRSVQAWAEPERDNVAKIT